ncbi:MAG: MarR family winged helix-turn-helix transcriptional regulator [Actinomycetota bacterium]
METEKREVQAEILEVVNPLELREEAFLRALGRVFVTVPRAFEADLIRERGMSLSGYFTLMHLSEAPDRWMRMSDLAAAADLSLSGMTRIVQRLEAEGLVRREKSPCDGRGWNAVLTDSGLSRLRAAWPTHLASVRRHVMNHLKDVDLDPITSAMQNFATGQFAPRSE